MPFEVVPSIARAARVSPVGTPQTSHHFQCRNVGPLNRGGWLSARIPCRLRRQQRLTHQTALPTVPHQSEYAPSAYRAPWRRRRPTVAVFPSISTTSLVSVRFHTPFRHQLKLRRLHHLRKSSGRIRVSRFSSARRCGYPLNPVARRKTIRTNKINVHRPVAMMISIRLTFGDRTSTLCQIPARQRRTSA